MISGFQRELKDICALLGFQTASGSLLPRFRNTLKLTSSLPLKMEPKYCPETSVETTKRCVKSQNSADLSTRIFNFLSRDTVVGTAAELQPGRSKVRIPAGLNVLALRRNVQTGSGTNSTFYSICSGIFLGDKVAGA